MTIEARITNLHSIELSPIRNGRLYIKELKPAIQRIRLTVTNGINGERSEVSFVPLLKRPGQSGKEINITYLYEGATNGESFGFFKLGNENEVYVLGKGSLLESHTNGHLVNPSDCRPISHEYLEVMSGWDMAFDKVSRKKIIPVAIHDVESVIIENLDKPVRLPKTSQYLRLLSEAQRL